MILIYANNQLSAQGDTATDKASSLQLSGPVLLAPTSGTRFIKMK